MKNEWIKTIENFFQKLVEIQSIPKQKNSSARKFRLADRFLILSSSNLEGDRRLDPIADEQKLLYLLTKRSRCHEISVTNRFKF
jgi:hypothetical protein